MASRGWRHGPALQLGLSESRLDVLFRMATSHVDNLQHSRRQGKHERSPTRQIVPSFLLEERKHRVFRRLEIGHQHGENQLVFVEAVRNALVEPLLRRGGAVRKRSSALQPAILAGALSEVEQRVGATGETTA